MKVSELIEELQKQDPDKTVWLPWTRGAFSPKEVRAGLSPHTKDKVVLV